MNQMVMARILASIGAENYDIIEDGQEAVEY